MLNIPNPAYTNAAHKNGVMSIGCLYFDQAFRAGQSINELLEKDAEGNFLLVDKLVAFIQENKIEEIVLGHPKNMDGTVGPRAEKCETLAKELEERTGLHVVLWDERRTTVAAHEILHRSGKKEKKHRQSVDAVAATLILQGYLDFKRRQ